MPWPRACLHRHNFVCDDGDLSPPLLKVVVTVTTTFSKIYLYFGQENCIFLATRSVVWPKTCRKCDSGRGSAPDPARGAHNASPDLVGWGAVTPPHTPHHSAPLAPRCSRLRGLDRCAPNTKSWRRHWSPPLFKVKLRQCIFVYNTLIGIIRLFLLYLILT